MMLKMLKTRKGCEDGWRVNEYIAGETYEIRDSLAKAFIVAGFAKLAGKDARESEQRKLRLMRQRLEQGRPIIFSEFNKGE